MNTAAARSGQVFVKSCKNVTIVTSTVNSEFRYAIHVSDSQLREAICSEVARLLKDLRIKRKLSMTELAARAGLSRAMISFVEHELRNPTLETLLRIAAVLEVDLAKVLEKASAGAAKNLGSCRKLTSKFKS